MKIIIPLLLLLPTAKVFALGAFDSAAGWSAQANMHGGAYTAAVEGAEAILFNPAATLQEKKREVVGAVVAFGGSVKAPLLPPDGGKKTDSNFIAFPSLVYTQQLDDKQAVSAGAYAIGGSGTDFQNNPYDHLGPGFAGFRGDNYALFAISEYSVAYARKLNSNLSAGLSLGVAMGQGQLATTQVLFAGGVAQLATEAKYKELKGYHIGAAKLGLKYVTDNKDAGLAVTYRNRRTMKMESEANGKIRIANGAQGTLKDSSSHITITMPESWTLGGYKEIFPKNKLHLEYAWVEYSKVKQIDIDSTLTNSLDGSQIDVPNLNSRWHDLQDYRIGWTNESIPGWKFGGGYSYSSPVTNRKYADPTFLPPAAFHHYYLGVSHHTDKYVASFGANYYNSTGRGKTETKDGGGGLTSPSLGGNYAIYGYTMMASLGYYF